MQTVRLKNRAMVKDFLRQLERVCSPCHIFNQLTHVLQQEKKIPDISKLSALELQKWFVVLSYQVPIRNVVVYRARDNAALLADAKLGYVDRALNTIRARQLAHSPEFT